MIFEGRVLTSSGAPLAQGSVSVVGPKGVIGKGAVREGALSAEAEADAAWGLLIDGKPIVAIPVTVEGDRMSLGDIALSDKGVRLAAFHAPDGIVFGLPAALLQRATSTETLSRTDLTATTTATAPAPAPVGITTGLTFSGLIGSAAKQLGDVTRETTGLNLTGATVTLKGIPNVTAEAVGLDFPTPELAATGAGLSQISFTLKPQGETAPPPTPTGPTMPDVIGYARELAARKLTSLGRATEFTTEIVRNAADQGRVVRSLPPPGAPLPVGAAIRLFIGKHEAS